MHWNNIATVAVAFIVAVIGYLGNIRAVKKGIADAEKARFADESVEHRRWLRDKYSEIYQDVITWTERRSLIRGRTAYGHVFPDLPELPELPPETTEAFSARMHLYATETTRKLFAVAEQANRNAFIQRQILADGRAAQARGDGTEPVVTLLKAAHAADTAAEEADFALIDQLRTEVRASVSSDPYPAAPRGVPAQR